jgi:uncharacterized protein YigA (DUF484 family)
MDKKAKKKMDVLRKRIHKMQMQLAGATEQMDEPEEVDRLKRDIQTAEADIEKLKDS